ncbi:MAG: DNA repair protein RadC [Patescibacteria group bacterium]
MPNKLKIKDLPSVNKNAGHRGRLRDRFLQSGLNGFLDYEIVELLLTLGTPRKDCKQMAKEVIKKFKSLRGSLDAVPEELQRIKGIGKINIFGFKLFQEIYKQYVKEKIPAKTILDSPKLVIDYLQEKLKREKKEHFVVLYLNAINQFIHEETISIGILNANLVHPREVFKPAIEHLAANIIIVHNHPSGGAEPSQDDIEVTKRIVEAGEIMGIEVLDHIIIAKGKVFSFKERKLI